MMNEEDETLYSFKDVKMTIHHQDARRPDGPQQY